VFGQGIGHGDKDGDSYQGSQEGSLNGNPKGIKEQQVLHYFLVGNKGKADGIKGNKPRVGGGFFGYGKAEGVPEGIQTGKAEKGHDKNVHDIEYSFA
jgi:hypothetical protein